MKMKSRMISYKFENRKFILIFVLFFFLPSTEPNRASDYEIDNFRTGHDPSFFQPNSNTTAYSPASIIPPHRDQLSSE